jgi:phosphopantetheinyl transferase
VASSEADRGESADRVWLWEAEVPQRGKARREATEMSLRLAVAGCLGHEEPAALELWREESGKPRLAVAPGEPELHFNLSHSDGTCLIAATWLAPVGVDLERIRERPRLEQIAERRFAPAEAEAILTLEGEERLRAFYRTWTVKEACLKATGTGIWEGVGDVVVDLGEGSRPTAARAGDEVGWSVAEVTTPAGFLGALALRGRHDLPPLLVPSPLHPASAAPRDAAER